MAEVTTQTDLLDILYSNMVNIKINLELANDFSVKNLGDSKRTLLDFGYNKFQFNLDIDFSEIIGLFYNEPILYIFKPDKESLWRLVVYSDDNTIVYIFQLSEASDIIYGENITPSSNMMGLLNNIKNLGV